LRHPSCHQLAAIRKEQEKQKLAEEAERLRKIAEEMEAARKAKDAEEAARAQQLKEMEERKKMEAEQKKADEEAQKQQEAARIKAEKEAAKKPQVGANVQTDPCYAALICFTCRTLVLWFDHPIHVATSPGVLAALRVAAPPSPTTTPPPRCSLNYTLTRALTDSTDVRWTSRRRSGRQRRLPSWSRSVVTRSWPCVWPWTTRVMVATLLTCSRMRHERKRRPGRRRGRRPRLPTMSSALQSR
jgi:hypothetical protein